MKTMTLEAQQLVLCLLDRECPGCSDCSSSGYKIPEQCGGTGRICLLDPDGKFGLRAPCPCLALIEYGADGTNHWSDREGCNECYLRVGRKDGIVHSNCRACRGRNWVPSTDLWAYVRAVWSHVQEAYHGEPLTRWKVLKAIQGALDNAQDPGQAAFDVVAEALLPPSGPQTGK